MNVKPKQAFETLKNTLKNKSLCTCKCRLKWFVFYQILILRLFFPDVNYLENIENICHEINQKILQTIADYEGTVYKEIEM